MSLKASVLRFAMYLKGRDGTCVQNVPFLPWVWTSFSQIPLALRLEHTALPKISVFSVLYSSEMPSSQESQLLSASAALRSIGTWKPKRMLSAVNCHGGLSSLVTSVPWERTSSTGSMPGLSIAFPSVWEAFEFSLILKTASCCAQPFWSACCIFWLPSA